MEPLLVLAVPLWIEKLKHKSFADFEKRRDSILDSVCYKGDLLLYGSSKKGETAKLFDDLAEGLAWLALIAKGGVTFGELHWDAEFETMPGLRSEHHESTLKSEIVPEMSAAKTSKASDDTSSGTDSASQGDDRKNEP
jgi:hypothetical protein